MKVSKDLLEKSRYQVFGEVVTDTVVDSLDLDNKKYNYILQSISSDYVLENNIRYRLVTLLTDFKTNSSVVDVKFMYEKTYLFNEILKIIKGG